MYAVIATGGKQERVEEGQRVQVEKLGPVDTTVELTPVLLVDGDTVLATPDQLAGAKVTARVVEETRGPKITGFVYQAKARRRRRWGHRQTLATIEITEISRG
jgi:large subunit ribosomal protein L21